MVDEFFAELRRLAQLVGGPLPKRWLMCAFISGLPQHIKHLLHASSRMETMSAEQLLTQARAVMTDNKGPIELAAASARQTPSESNQICLLQVWWSQPHGKELLAGLPSEARQLDAQGSL